jgi:hypothetical protein
MRRLLLALALTLAACEHGGHGGGGFGHFGGGGGGGGHVSSSSSSSSSHMSSSQLGHSSSSSSGSELAHVWRTTVNGAVAVSEALAASSADGEDAPPPEPSAPAIETTGPLIDDHDPCNTCPDDLLCGQCSFSGHVCAFAPAGAHARCATPP